MSLTAFLVSLLLVDAEEMCTIKRLLTEVWNLVIRTMHLCYCCLLEYWSLEICRVHSDDAGLPATTRGRWFRVHPDDRGGALWRRDVHRRRRRLHQWHQRRGAAARADEVRRFMWCIHFRCNTRQYSPPHPPDCYSVPSSASWTCRRSINLTMFHGCNIVAIWLQSC